MKATKKVVLPNDKGFAIVSCNATKSKEIKNWVVVNCSVRTEICGVKHRYRFRIRALPILHSEDEKEFLQDLARDELEWFLDIFRRIISGETKVLQELLNRYGIYCVEDIKLDDTRLSQISVIGEIALGLSLLVRFVKFAEALYNIKAEEILQQLCQS